MYRFLASLCAMAAVFISSCADLTNSDRDPTGQPPGSATLSITTGRVGMLAKNADISLARLCVSLSAPDETTLFDTANLTGFNEQTVTLSFNTLASLKTWTFNAYTEDANDSIIHETSTTFRVHPRQTVPVSLSMQARFSMLKVRFFPIRDSVTRCAISVDNTLKSDSSFAKQSKLGDTVIVGFEYLYTNTSQRVRFDVFGNMWGFDTLLYTGDTLLNPSPGTNQHYVIRLRWVGPALPPPGQASMVVTVGPVGSTDVDVIIGDIRPVNLALNITRSGFPSPEESDNGWGGGTSKWDMLDGLQGYTDTWAHGLAFTGGRPGYMGEPCGWRQATVDFGEQKMFSRVRVYHHGDEHIPNAFTIQYFDGTQWIEIMTTTDGKNYLREDLRYTGQGWGSVPTEVKFAAVTGSKVRFLLNNCDIEHGWIYEFEVFNQ
jgi:hypothetical protein